MISIISVGFFAYQQLTENSLNSSIDQSHVLMNEIRLDIQSFEENTSSNIKLFSNDTLLQKYVVSDEDHRYELLLPTLLRIFGSYQKAYPDYYEIRVIMPDGYEDARKINRDIKNITDDESKTSAVNQMMKSPDKISSFYAENPDNGELSYYISKPIIIKDRSLDTLIAKPKLRAFLSLTTSLEWLIGKLNNAKIGKSDTTFITDTNGIILISNSTLFPASENIKRIFNSQQGKLYVSKLLNKITTNKHVTLSINDNSGYLWSLPVSNKFMLFSWNPNQEIISQSTQLGIKISLIILLSIIALSFFVFNLLKYLITNPIKNLEISANAIGRGDLLEDINIKANDEIGSLANSFNQMRKNLLQSHEQIKYLAYHDNLTGLPNRLMFLEYVTQAVAFAKRNNEQLSVVFIDLDNFKRVNDTLGHEAGDELLKEVSDRILRCLRETDYIARPESEMSDIAARIGGDEFLILLHNIPDSYLPGIVSDRIIKSLSNPININKNEFHIGASIGITVYPEDGESPDELIKNSDIAMYVAKTQGKNHYQYYTTSMNEAMIERLEIERKLRTALSKNQLFLVYQPQIDTVTKEVYGVEALVRWNDPEEGIISPAVFIPIAEETGLIVDIGAWVLKQACLQLKNWQRHGCHNLKISVNVSAIQFSKSDLPKLVADTLKETDLAPTFLDIEITETVIMENLERVCNALIKIRESGVTISLDDFGTGYSSLNYLRQFPLDILKIDQSFVAEINDISDEKSAIIKAIIAMSHALELKVIAEGIETESQYNRLAEWECDIIQGYYFHRPLPHYEIEKLISISNKKEVD